MLDLNNLFDRLYPLNRSILGNGYRQSLDIISEYMDLDKKYVPSGKKVFDWEVPKEWVIECATLIGPDGRNYINYESNNLSVLNYSDSIDIEIEKAKLAKNVFTLPNLPTAVPYVTSYYKRNWGFCLAHEEWEKMPVGKYHANIRTRFVDGQLVYGHSILQGKTDKLILLSSYLCHPSLANNELSGPLVLAELYNRISQWDNRNYTYKCLVF